MEPGFFIKLSEIPDLATRLADPDFNDRLRADPASVFAEYGIAIPEGLIPDPEELQLPSTERIAEIKRAIALLEGDDGEDFPWFPFIFPVAIPWFPGPWFWPWIRRPDSSE
jgi:hypothetical protein